MKSFGRILSEGGNTKEWLIFLGVVTSIIMAVLAFKWQSRRVQRRIEMRRKLRASALHRSFRRELLLLLLLHITARTTGVRVSSKKLCYIYLQQPKLNLYIKWLSRVYTLRYTNMNRTSTGNINRNDGSRSSICGTKHSKKPSLRLCWVGVRSRLNYSST